jgi:predicted RNA-binding protein YlqC (UPF0109 family)
MSTEPVRKLIALSIKEESIPGFVGKGGSSIKRHIIKATKESYFGTGSISSEQWSSVRLGIHIEKEEKDGGVRVVAKILAPDMKCAELAREKILKHQSIYMKRVDAPKRNTYYFNVNLRHNLLGKVIGSGGKNIRSLRERIMALEEDGNSPTKMPIVNISENDGRENQEIFEKNEYNESLKVKVVVEYLSKEVIHVELYSHFEQYIQERENFSGDGFEEWEVDESEQPYSGNGWD